MSNVITGDPLILDTAATTVVVSNLIHVTKVLWAGSDIAAADTAILQDKLGIVKVELGAVGADEHRQADFNPPLPCNGLIMATLGHGKLYVYWDHGKAAPKA